MNNSPTVGIFTIHKSIHSFGACLQCFALYKVLEQIGAKPEVVNFSTPAYLNFIPSKRYPTPNQKNHYKSLLYTLFYRAIHPGRVKQIISFRKFNSQLTYSKKYRKYDYLMDSPPEYDIYLTGSDQVWNNSLDQNILPFLQAFNIKRGIRASYASSIGKSFIDDYQNLYFKKYLPQFSYISVREQTARDILGEVLPNKDIEVCIDPTLLLNNEYWSEVAQSIQVAKPYVLLFLLKQDPKVAKFAFDLAHKNNCELLVIGPKYDNLINCRNLRFLGPQEWLGYIKNAYHVITDSFHGMVFSLRLSRNYSVIISNKTKASRILDLSRELHLESQIIDGAQTFLSETLDKAEAFNRLEAKRKAAITYLKNIINSAV